jgi:hypothetical protein
MTQKRKTLQVDGINTNSGVVFIDRPELVRQIIETADEDQHVILSALPATGMTSLLMLVMRELKSQNNEGTVLFFCYPEKGRSGETILSLLRNKNGTASQQTMFNKKFS